MYRKRKKKTYMASIIGSDPVRFRLDTEQGLAILRKPREIKRRWWEHSVFMSMSDRHHYLTTCLHPTNHIIFIIYNMLCMRVSAY